jgi:hypothetical protein
MAGAVAEKAAIKRVGIPSCQLPVTARSDTLTHVGRNKNIAGNASLTKGNLVISSNAGPTA